MAIALIEVVPTATGLMVSTGDSLVIPSKKNRMTTLLVSASSRAGCRTRRWNATWASIRDLTPLMHPIRDLMHAGRHDDGQALLPKEPPYEVEARLAASISATA